MGTARRAGIEVRAGIAAQHTLAFERLAYQPACRVDHVAPPFTCYPFAPTPARKGSRVSRNTLCARKSLFFTVPSGRFLNSAISL